MKKSVYVHTGEEHRFINEVINSDMSFKPTSIMESLFSNTKKERQAYESGMRIGYYQGCYSHSSEGMLFTLHVNITNEIEKAFYNEFIKLCEKYNIGITYHPTEGLKFIRLYQNEKEILHT